MKKILLAVLIAALPGAGSAQSHRIESDAGAASLLSAASMDYGRAKPGARIDPVLANSTTAALGKLCRGEISVAGAARPASMAERNACARAKIELIELPLATDSIALVVNPANYWAKQLSVAEFKRAWLETPGKAVSWKQVNAAWPETPLKLYGPGPKLGLGLHTRAALNSGAVEAVPELRSDISATEVLSVVVEGVARDRAGLGLLDQATYRANMKRVRLVPVEGLPAFRLYVYTTAKALGDAGTRAYLDHLLANGARLAPQAGLGALAPSSYEQSRQRIAAGRPQ